MIFRITGGELTIRKKTFIKEMLSPASPLKTLLNYELEDAGKTRKISTDRSRNRDLVYIDYTFADSVTVGEDYENLLRDLKKKYRGDVRGRVVLTAHDYFEAVALTLNLESDDDTMVTNHR